MRRGKSSLHLYTEKQVRLAMLCYLPQLSYEVFEGDYRWAFAPKAAVREPILSWRADARAVTDGRAHTAVLGSAAAVASWIYSVILQDLLVWTLLVIIIIPEGKRANRHPTLCQAPQVHRLGLSAKRAGKFFFSLISDMLVFILSFQVWMYYPLWPLSSPKILKSQTRAHPALKIPRPFMQELLRWSDGHLSKARKMQTGAHWERLASQTSLSLHILKSYLDVTERT